MSEPIAVHAERLVKPTATCTRCAGSTCGSSPARCSASSGKRRGRLRDSPIGPIAFTGTGEPRRNEIAFARAARDLGGPIPSVFNDVAGGVVEGTVRPPVRLVANAR
jgi:hypothetical protein